MVTTARTRPWTGPRRSRRATSTTARSRSTAAPTRSSATSSPRRCWDCRIRRVGRAKRNPPSSSAQRDGFRCALPILQGRNMDFDLSEEQRLLKESVDGLLTDTYDFDSRKKYASEKGGWSRSVWAKLAEQGLLGLPFS